MRRLLRASFFGLKKFAAPGVDEMTWTEYAKGLEENLSDLRSRVQTRAYRALPSRRTYIPKPDGRQRPLGIAALEDKIVQAAVVAIRHDVPYCPQHHEPTSRTLPETAPTVESGERRPKRFLHAPSAEERDRRSSHD